jgi:uncharacterized protein (DUF302 family)
MSQYAFSVETNTGIDETQKRLIEALAAERLGIVSEVNVQAIMNNKLGVEIPGYRILGACAPALAKRVIDAVPAAGALLPCNIVLRELEGGRTAIDFMHPQTILDLAENAEVTAVGNEAMAILQRVADALRG